MPLFCVNSVRYNEGVHTIYESQNFYWIITGDDSGSLFESQPNVGRAGA